MPSYNVFIEPKKKDNQPSEISFIGRYKGSVPRLQVQLAFKVPKGYKLSFILYK